METTITFRDPYLDTKSVEEVGGLNIEYPLIQDGEITDAIDELKSYSRSYFSSVKEGEIQETNAALDQYFSNPDHPEIMEMIRKISKTCGFSEHDISHYGLGLFSMLQKEDNDAGRFIDKAMRSSGTISTSKGYLRRYGPVGLLRKWKEPELISHFISGNVVGYTAVLSRIGLPIRKGGAGQILKLPSASAFFPLLYLDKLNSINPALRKTMICGYWKGGDDRVEQPILRNSDAVNILSSDAAIEDLKSRIRKYNPNLKALYHGHKIGIAYISSDFLENKDLRQQSMNGLIRDISAFDGGACYTVKNIYVQGDHRSFAEELQSGLNAFADSVSAVSEAFKPVGNSLGKIYSGSPNVMFSESRSAFIRYVDHAEFWKPDELYRYVQVMPVRNEKEMIEAIRNNSRFLQTAITAVPDKEIEEIFYLLGMAGISNMHYPGSAALFDPYEEPHDGEFDFIKIRYNYSCRFSATNYRKNRQWLN